METRIKERLTGALILVAALVVLVPEIFSGRHISERSREAPPAAPASEGAPLRSYTTELSATKPPPIESSVEPPGAVQAPPVAEKPPIIDKPAQEPKSVPAMPAQSQSQSQAPAQSHVQAPAPAPASTQPAVSSGGEWFVQVGSFSQGENAERFAQQLRKQGYASIVLPPAGSKGLSRVRVGPARTRDAAVALLERLNASGHKGAVVGP